MLLNFCFAQMHTVEGTVVDALSSESLIGATVSSGSSGTTTDIDGNFSFQLEAGSHKLEISYVGYQTKELDIELDSDVNLNIQLESAAILTEIVVTADIAIERETPVAFSNIPTLKLEEELAAQDIPMLLRRPSVEQSTPPLCTTMAARNDAQDFLRPA